MAAEDAMEEDDDDVDFNPYLQLSPSLDGASGESSEGEGEIEETEDDVELEIQEESVNGEDLQISEKETEREKDLDEDEFLELGSDEDEEEDFEEEEQDEMVQVGGGNSELEGFSAKSVSLEKARKHMAVRSRSEDDEDDKHGPGADSNDQILDPVQRVGEADESLGVSSHGFLYVTETETPGRSKDTMPELRIFRRAMQSEEILRGDSSDDLGDDSVDAISKRTRAHYSLADMSLDQLEMFLQESDEEEYFQNVDDEEEYRKFLLAVQEKEDGGDEQRQDDEDEDADFEFEIEEALESDYDDASGFTKKRKRRRPETRENRRQRAKTHSKGLNVSQMKAPLRPLLPNTSNLQYSAHVTEKRNIAVGGDQGWAPNQKKKVPVNGFTAHQIGQLYCLIHEHVQLLVQVYSMCILEPTRHKVAKETRKMLTEMADKRDMVLSWKKTAFPGFCFQPPYTHPSFTETEEEKTLAHRFQLPSDPEACSRDTTGGIDAYPVSSAHGSDGDMVLWSSVESGSSTSALPSRQLNLLSCSNLSLVSQPSTYPGTIDSTPFLLDHPSELSHRWHQTLNICQTPGAVPTTIGVADTMHVTDQSSVSPYVKVGTCFGEGYLSGPMLMKSVPPATAQQPSSCSLASSKKTPQSFSAAGEEGHGLVNAVTSEWAPITSGPVRSLLDVAPLALVRDFLDDMSRVAEDYTQRHVESGAYHSECEREPLFMISISDQREGDARRNSKARPSSLSFHFKESLPVSAPRIPIKKTMAAALVESTKKESLALVPKDVASAVQRFLPFFNEALFPHKPPPMAAAARLLFTDAEDELLAMGLMIYNNDWTSIQQRFLPSKTMHQIFVRQKNRSSARAPENSIKAVRRMKSSPLTAVEKACIQEGLKIYKYDWNKVWEFCVPHRDPAILPRQWRIALGTQKSYKTSETSKERRRVYEANRRQAKKASEYGLEVKKDSGPSSVETGIEGRDVISGEDEEYVEDAYIREAFLADWCPSTSASVGAPLSLPGGPPTQRTKTKASVAKKKKVLADQVPDTKPVSAVPAFNLAPGSSNWFNRQALMFGTNVTKQTVKLAPDLPSVKLPPHVHVLSQALVPAVPPRPSTGGAEFYLNPVSSRWSHITDQKWSRISGQSIDRAVTVNPSRYVSTFLPQIVSASPFEGSKLNRRASSKPIPLPAEHGKTSTTEPILHLTSELPIANEPGGSFGTATNVDLQRLAKDLDRKFGISQPVPTVDLNQTLAPIRPLAELVQANVYSLNPLPPKETTPAPSQSFGHTFLPVPGAVEGSGGTSVLKSTPRRRKERASVVLSNSSSTQHVSTLSEHVSTEIQESDLPQPCVQAGTSCHPKIREREHSSTPALLKSDCSMGPASKLSSSVPSKAQSKVLLREGVSDQLETEIPVEPSQPSKVQKDQVAPNRGPLSKKISAKRSRKSASVKQAGRAKHNGKQSTDKAVHGCSQVQTGERHSPKICQPIAAEAGLKGGQRRRKQKTQERVETRIEDPHSEPHVIVMEQEELSDSEDEAGIGVEFEHEEMGDSDKDAEFELAASNQFKESSIEFEEEEIESEDSPTGERMRGELTELFVIPAAGPSSAESSKRERRMKLQSSNQDVIHKGETFRTETADAVQLITEAPGGCANSRNSRQNSPDPEGQQAERANKTRARAKFTGLEVSACCSHQVGKKRGHDLAKNVPPRGEGRTEGGNELDSFRDEVPAVP
ncbi:hypothetical protein Mapa_016950 [Marchantia paleacea]|nr:hypothetical protein Mapa_016950 [Marchantia paleacea]